MSPMEDRRGERFGRYEILSELGRGAMGVVYKARDPKINRVVAVKTFALSGQPPEEEQEFRERFFREAEAAGRLSHPGIVTIYDVGEEPETRAPYIVMEFVGGQSLEKLLSQNDHKLPLETALQLTHELSEALDCAHGQGVVHRDLKPANILITEDGHAKIADFGVAKLNLANHTLGGRTLGTPAYMSPEQLNGETVDGRSDLFSLGVVLYTVLTGYRPFQGNSAMTVSFKVVNRDPVPASVLDTELPPGLDYIIGRAMAKDPAERYQRGMEMALDIQDLRDGRELWSKAKQPGSLAGIAQQAGDRARPSSIGQGKSSASARARQSRRVESGLVEKLSNKKSLAALLLLVGLAVLGMRLGPLTRTRKLAPRNTTASRSAPMPMPLVGEDATPKMATPKTAPSAPTVAASVPPSAAVSAGASKKSSKSSKTRGAGTPASVKTAGQVLPAAGATLEPATLDIEIEHKFTEAQLSIWVDSHLSYTHALEGTNKKHLVVFHSVQGHEFHAVEIPAGDHQLRVRVTSDANRVDKSATIAGKFASGKEKLLKIHFDKQGEMTVSLE
jgi:serine/threonine protein kinase